MRTRRHQGTEINENTIGQSCSKWPLRRPKERRQDTIKIDLGKYEDGRWMELRKNCPTVGFLITGVGPSCLQPALLLVCQ